MLHRLMTVASLGLLVGCTRETMVVPPEALPALARSQAVTYTRTKDGRRVVEQGPIRWVGVHGGSAEVSKEVAPPGEPHSEWYRGPFEATLAGGALQIADENGRSSYALRDIRQIEILYDARVGSPAMGMRIVGIVLTSLGSALLVGGVATTGWIVGSPRNSPLAVYLLGVPLMASSTVFAGVGIPLWVQGARAATAPTLAPTGNGAALRWAF